jgi:hypothetical protein
MSLEPFEAVPVGRFAFGTRSGAAVGSGLAVRLAPRGRSCPLLEPELPSRTRESAGPPAESTSSKELD